MACLLAGSPDATLCIEGFGSIVTSTTAPIATGWSNSYQVGIAPTEERRLSTAHGHTGFFFGLCSDDVFVKKNPGFPQYLPAPACSGVFLPSAWQSGRRSGSVPGRVLPPTW